MKTRQNILFNIGFALLLIFISLETFADKIYSGKVVPLVKNKIPAGSDADYWGYLKFVAKWGAIIKPQITDMNGKVVKKGTVLTQMTRKYWVGKVNVAKGMLLAAEQSLKTAQENFARYRKLFPSGAVPVKEYQDMRAIYYEALGTFEAAKADLRESEIVLEDCTQFAPFEGIVDKVYYTSGTLSPNPDVIEISQLNPIGIKVEMDLIEASKIGTNTPISIFLPGNETPLGIYNGYFMLYDNGIILSTKNKPKRNNDKNLPEFRECAPIIRFFINRKSDAIGVPIESLQKDDKGYYVWKAKDRKTMQAGKGLNPIFQIEKVYIVLGKLKRLYYGVCNMRVIKEPGSLQLHDIVLISPPKNLKDGMTVSFPPERYKLMPGDNVKVVIGKQE